MLLAALIFKRLCLSLQVTIKRNDNW